MKNRILKTLAVLLVPALSLSGCWKTMSPRIAEDTAVAESQAAVGTEGRGAYRPKSIVERYREKARSQLARRQYDEARKTCESILMLAPEDTQTLEMLEQIQGPSGENEQEMFAPQPRDGKVPELKTAEAQVTEGNKKGLTLETLVKPETAAKAEPAPEKKEKPAQKPAPKPEAKAEEKAVPEVPLNQPLPPKLKVGQTPSGKPLDLSRGNLRNAQKMDTPEYAKKASENDFIFAEMPHDITQQLYKEYLYDRSIEVYRQAAARFPDSSKAPYAFIEIGKFHKGREELDDAVKNFETVIAKYGADTEAVSAARYFIAEIRYQQKNYQEAYNLLTQILKNSVSYPLVGRTCLLRGKVLEKLGAWEKGMSDLYTVLSLGETSDRYNEANLEIADMYVRHNRMGDAITHLKTSLPKIAPADREKAALRLAELYRKNRLFKLERQLLSDFIAGPLGSHCDHKLAVYALADCYFASNDLENAYHTYTVALKDYPIKEKTLEALYRRGYCGKRLGFYKDALQAFGEVIGRGSYGREWVQSKMERAEIYAELKKPREAAEDLKDVITFSKDDKVVMEAYNQLASLLREQGKTDDAQMLLDKALISYAGKGDTPAVKINFARTLKQAGKFSEAIEVLEALGAIKNAAQEQERLTLLAELFFESQQYDRAAKTYKTLLEQAKDAEQAAPVLYSIGRCYELNGRKNDAIESYKDLIRQYPGTMVSQQAEWNIKNINWQSQYGGRERNP